MPRSILLLGSGFLVAATFLAGFAWLLLPFAVVADLLTAPRRMPATRLTLMGWGYALFETIGVVRAFGLWLRFGGDVTGPRALQRHHQLQRWWAASIIGVAEFLQIATIANTQQEFLGKGLQPVTYAFVAVGYWAFAYTMSKESRRLETRLGVGTR